MLNHDPRFGVKYVVGKGMIREEYSGLDNEQQMKKAKTHYDLHNHAQQNYRERDIPTFCVFLLHSPPTRERERLKKELITREEIRRRNERKIFTREAFKMFCFSVT